MFILTSYGKKHLDFPVFSTPAKKCCRCWLIPLLQFYRSSTWRCTSTALCHHRTIRSVKDGFSSVWDKGEVAPSRSSAAAPRLHPTVCISRDVDSFRRSAVEPFTP